MDTKQKIRKTEKLMERLTSDILHRDRERNELIRIKINAEDAIEQIDILESQWVYYHKC